MNHRSGLRAKPIPHEHRLQAEFVRWIRTYRDRYPQLWNGFAVPNGGHRDVVTATLLKAEGVEPGVPDWFLLIPRKPYHGLVIEHKVKPGKPSEEQLAWFERLRKAGYRVELVYDDPDESKRIVNEYLGLDIPLYC